MYSFVFVPFDFPPTFAVPHHRFAFPASGADTQFIHRLLVTVQILHDRLSIALLGLVKRLFYQSAQPLASFFVPARRSVQVPSQIFVWVHPFADKRSRHFKVHFHRFSLRCVFIFQHRFHFGNFSRILFCRIHRSSVGRGHSRPTCIFLLILYTIIRYEGIIRNRLRQLEPY